MKMRNMIEIDGTTGSGGGQILRTAIALAAVIKKPCHIFNIRAKRPKPGLMSQHLLGLQALAQLSNGRLEGDYLGSEEIKFYPDQNYRDQISINIPTAGSITLILQTLIPPALFAQNPTKIIFDGGATDTFFSPSFDYFRYVFLKILEKMGGKVEIDILRRGYFPVGGSRVAVKVFPSKLKPISLTERGELKKILIFSCASEFLKEKKVAERQAMESRKIFEKLKLPIETKIEYAETDCPGSSICIVSEFSNTFLGSDGLGKLGTPAEEIGKKATLQLLEEEKTKACLDKYLSDQILVYMALSGKLSQITVSKITNHCLTNIWTIEKFLPGKFKIEKNLIKWIP